VDPYIHQIYDNKLTISKKEEKKFLEGKRKQLSITGDTEISYITAFTDKPNCVYASRAILPFCRNLTGRIRIHRDSGFCERLPQPEELFTPLVSQQPKLVRAGPLLILLSGFLQLSTFSKDARWQAPLNFCQQWAYI
jgi:hypothetical protein